jgi:hypothetical protein
MVQVATLDFEKFQNDLNGATSVSQHVPRDLWPKFVATLI